MKKWDVLIVGSGISSLTCAALLSKKGMSVCVVEKYVKPGGYLHCFRRFNHQYDTGAHYVGGLEPGQPFHTLLSYVDAFDSEMFVPLDPTGFDVMSFPTFSVEFAKGYEETAENVAKVFPNERAAIRTYFDMIKTVPQNFPTYNYQEEYNTSNVMEALGTPLSKVVEKLTDNPKLRSVFYTYCGLHGVMPEDLSFGFHAVVTDSLLQGPYGFRHGGDALANKLVSVIKNNGGRVVLKNGVTELRVDDKHNVESVMTQTGEEFFADNIISGIHPKATFRLLTRDNFTPAFRTRLEKIEESMGMFGIYAHCKSRPPIRVDKNYYYFASEDPKTMLEVKGPGYVPGAFVARPDRAEKENDFSLVMHGAGPLEWFERWRSTKYGKRPEDYVEFKHRHAEKMIELVDSRQPGMKDCIEKFTTSSPLTNLFFNGSEDGSGYGIYHSVDNSGIRALGPSTKIRNLYLTGQSCLFPGLLGAATSAIRTSGCLIGMKPLLKELRELKEKSL